MPFQPNKELDLCSKALTPFPACCGLRVPATASSTFSEHSYYLAKGNLRQIIVRRSKCSNTILTRVTLEPCREQPNIT